jgi:metal-sulfur cluster biosynthetic enzyme
MYEDLPCSLPAGIERQEVLDRLDRVLDPELDESVLKLGFVDSIAAEKDHLTVELRLPTYWCAPNFSFLMAEDVRRELLTVEHVRDVTVRLQDHFASSAIERGVNSGQSFAEAFPDEAFEGLEQVRALFLRKGFIKRQERLLRSLRDAGLSYQEIVALTVADIVCEGGFCAVRRDDGCLHRIGKADLVQRYLERREHLGLASSPTGPLMADRRGDALSAQQMEKYFVYARTVRVSLEANGSLCSALLAQRQLERTR